MRKGKVTNIMLRVFIYTILCLTIICLPAMADQPNAMACNHNTGECFDADADLDFGIVTIYFKDSSKKTLEIDDDYPDDLTAYDDKDKIYYDLDILPGR
jgi:hypothetical protein